MVTTRAEASDSERVSPFGGHRRPILLENAGKIVVGDWLRDLGTFRQVTRVETLPDTPGTGPTVIVHFVPQPGMPDLALGITWRVKVTVWQDLASPKPHPDTL